MTRPGLVMGLGLAALAALVGACHGEPPPPEGVRLRIGPEARAVGEALTATKAPRLSALGRRLSACGEGALIAAPRIDADLIVAGVTCSPQPAGVTGTIVRDAEVWRLAGSANGVDVLPPSTWQPPPDLRGVSAPGAWLTVRWWTDPATLVGTFPSDIVPRALSLALTGEVALVVMAPPRQDRPPRLAFGLGLRESVSPSLVTRALEDAARRLGGRSQRESTPVGDRHCIPGLEIAEGFQPCALVLNEGFVIVGMDGIALDAVTPTAALERGTAVVAFDAAALAAADAVLGVPGLELPITGARLATTDKGMRLEWQR
jgi:hypothetical protein